MFDQSVNSNSLCVQSSVSLCSTAKKRRMGRMSETYVSDTSQDRGYNVSTSQDRGYNVSTSQDRG